MEIVLENAGRKFNRQWIFRHLSLQIASGERIAIIGANGSGKSTLISCIATYLMLSEGDIQFFHQGNVIQQQALQRYFSWMAPAVDLPDELNISEVLRLHFSLKGCTENMEGVNQWLDIAGLSAHREKRIKQLSSGMKQRVKMLTAFLSDVSCILLDEPTTNLDTEGKALYHQLILEKTHQKTIIIASNLPEEYQFCERTVTMDKKKTG